MRKILTLLIGIVFLGAFPAWSLGGNGLFRNQLSAISPLTAGAGETSRLISGYGIRNPRLKEISMPFRQLADRAAMPVAEAPVYAASGNKRFRATVIYENDWGGNYRPYAVKEFIINGKTISTRNLSMPGDITWACYAGGSNYLVAYEIREGMNVLIGTVIYRYDIDTNTLNGQWNLPGDKMIYSGAYDPETGLCYMFVGVNDGKGVESRLMTLDPETIQFTDVAAVSATGVPVIMFDGKGRMYWHEISDGSLSLMDKHTGAKTLIGKTGITHQYLTSGCIDPESDLCYIASNTDSSALLYTVDLTTAKATVVGNMPKLCEISGAYIAPSGPESGAPGEATKVTFEFEKDALSGQLSFTAPSLTAGGTPLASDQELDYRIEWMKTVIATGKVEAGTRISVPLTFEKPGTYKLELTLSNSVGDSKTVTASHWIGYDVPDIMERPVLSKSAGKFVVEWKRPSSLNGNQLDYADMRYRLVRSDGAVTEVGNVTRFEEDQPAYDGPLTPYTYKVIPVYRGFGYKEIETNKAYLGYVEENYSNDFDEEDRAAEFTVEDANNDGLTWEWTRMYRNYRSAGKQGVSKDDWLFTPAIKMKAGHTYPFEFDIYKELVAYDEQFEIRVGRSPQSSAMTETVVGPVAVDVVLSPTLEDQLRKSFSYTCNEDGIYYIGIRSCAPNTPTQLFIDNFHLSYSSVPTTPVAVSSLSVTPGALGALTATISFTAPSVDITGNALTDLEQVGIYRDTRLIATLHPAPGEAVTYTDNLQAKGEHEYTVVPAGSGTIGASASSSCYVGYAAPAIVENVTASVSDYNIINLSWDPVAADINGLAYAPGAVTYELFVYQNSNMSSLGTVKDNSAQLKFNLQEQFYLLFAVVAKADGMMSEDFGVAPQVLAGVPYTLPFTESFANAHSSHPWFIYNGDTGFGTWKLLTDKDFSDEYDPNHGIISADADNGFLGYEGYTTGEISRFFCGNINLPANTLNPTLKFSHVVRPTVHNVIDVVIKEADSDWTVVASYPCNGDNDGWKEEYLDLSDYAGKVFQLGFQANLVDNANVFVDAIRLYSMPDYNLRLRGENSAEAHINQPCEVEFTVDNNGKKATAKARMTVSSDDAETVSYDIPAMNPSESVVINHKFTTTLHSPEKFALKAEIVYDEDGEPTDNVALTTVNTNFSELPEPRDLSAIRNDNGEVTLTWTEPDLETLPRTGDVDDFESYTHMATSGIGDWTVFNSGQTKLQFYPYVWPEIHMQNVSFFIVDTDVETGMAKEGLRAHSGSKFIAAVYNNDYTPNDDWLVSPRLDGKARKVSLWVRSAMVNYPETIEVLLSLTGNSREDFTHTAVSEYTVPAQWTKLEFEVPAGTRHVALHSTSLCQSLLMVDDFELNNGSFIETEIIGYNIYRDKVKLNAQPVTSLTFTDNADGDSHIYSVSAVYDRGEGRISAPASVASSGIGSTVAGDIKVTSQRGSILVSGAEGLLIRVFDVAGRSIASVIGSHAITRFDVEPGIYIVDIRGRSTKILVK